MTDFKRKLRFGYEKEIRISLLFFILFLVLLNFGTFVLLTRTKIELEKQFDLKLRSVATSSASLWKNSGDKSSESFQKTLQNLAFETKVKTIAFLSQEGKILVSTDSSSQKDDYSEFVGSTTKAGDFYYIPSGDKKGVWRSYIYPVFDRATESNILIFVKSEAKTLHAIERLSEIDSFLIGVGVLLILFLAFLFIRTILKPFSILREKAAQAKKRSPAQKSDVDFVIQAFSDTIAELRKKERILEGLYQGTKKDAERLSKLNEYILKSISSGVMVCDKEGEIIRLNESALKILGEAETYFMNRPFYQALEGFDQVKKFLNQGLGKKIFVSNEEIEVEDKKGRRICLGISTSSIKNERGEVLGIIMLLNDFTELKRLQEEMAFKEKMAVLGEMSAGLAHELRNSMVSILGYSKLLKKLLTADDSTREIIEGIINESCGMEVMLKKFLNITKPLEIVASKFDIEKVIREAKKSTEKEIPGIDFEMNFDKSLPHLYGDQLLLKQVFQNLFHNAIEAMPEGGKLGVTVIPKGDFLEIDISDTGYGISEKNLKKIFNPFFSSKQKGVGLGLSLVKKIITSHQGRVEVESQERKGTTFKIFLPFHLKVRVKKKVKV
ncbi:MAG: hypothetical protein AMJ90_02530 [candidate division Zixibacteria bacterium SM23_73_2]|nr:MAG: hypothetical protein AMJ90_02530 [candidate division Zixibacteria bacterium SM23_73_2]